MMNYVTLLIVAVVACTVVDATFTRALRNGMTPSKNDNDTYSFVGVSAGWRHACGTTRDNTALCWGLHAGEMGVNQHSHAKQIAPGHDFTCILFINGSVQCVGTRYTVAPVVPQGLTATLISADKSHACAIEYSGDVVCWGRSGRIGQIRISNASRIFGSSLSTRTCATLADGSVNCWDDTGHEVDSFPSTAAEIQHVAIGPITSCVVFRNGTTACKGSTIHQELEDVVEMEIAEMQTCALLKDHTVQCWGPDAIYDEALARTNHFNPMERNNDVVQITAGEAFMCALHKTGRFTCWGDDTYGQASPPHRETASLLNTQSGAPELQQGHRPLLGPFVDVAVGDYFTCGATQHGTITCWPKIMQELYLDLGAVSSVVVSKASNVICGLSAEGRVACVASPGTLPSLAVPPSLLPVKELSMGGYHACVIQVDRRLVCWGSNSHGQLVPAEDTPMEAMAVSTGALHTCAITSSNSSVTCWGSNDDNQSTVPALNEAVISLASGWYHACAVLASGRVTCWGRNTQRQLDVPQGLMPVISVSCGESHSCALLANGSVTCWGASDRGQTRVPEDVVQANKLSCGRYHTCALMEDGHVRCWGENSNGRSEPVYEGSQGNI